MNNLVLYRKYRPQSFAELVGQEHVVQTLTNSIKNNSISHAYLFSGPRGSGKTTIARILAKAVNCENPQKGFEPCNKCNSCTEISNSKSLDLIEIDAASHTGVEEVREMIESLKFSPISSKYKIFIIDECHQLSKGAANALLKTLEEPPAHVVFILATTEAHKMIPTILSRCQKFDFRRLKIAEITKKLENITKKENIKFDESALSLIAINSRGSFRDAESLLDECISFSSGKGSISSEEIKSLLGIVDVSQISKFVDFLVKKDAKGSINFIAEIIDRGVDLQEFAKALIFYLRQELILKIDSDFLNLQNSGLSKKELDKMKEQTSNIDSTEIQKIIEYFIEAENKIKYSSIPQLPLELASINSTN